MITVDNEVFDEKNESEREMKDLLTLCPYLQCLQITSSMQLF